MRKRLIKVAAIVGLVSICASGCTNPLQGTTEQTTTPAAVTDSQSSSAAQQAATNEAETTTNVQESISASAATTQPVAAAEITEEQAKAIAFQNAQVAAEEVTAIRVQRDIEDGVPVYDVEFYVQNREYDYEIRVADGVILSVDYEVEDDFRVNAGTAIISEAEAKQIVLSRIPGATEQNIYIRLDTDDGIQEYEGEVIINNTKYEFEINAQTGELTNWEQD